MVRHIIENYTKLTPAILEIPSKEHAYDPSKDFILKRAQVICLIKKKDFNLVLVYLFYFRKCSQQMISNKLLIARMQFIHGNSFIQHSTTIFFS